LKIKPFSIIFEDNDIIAVNKNSGIAVCADRWNYSKRRLDTLLAEVSGKRLFTVHRIDSGTSGIVVFAKNAAAHRRLSIAFETRVVHKTYTAVVHGVPRWTETSCDAPLVVNGDKRHRTIIDRYRGKKSLTRFRLLSRAGNISIVEAYPESGRTHQIRVHLARLGHPIICDALYGKDAPLFLSEIKKSWRGDRLDERPLMARLALHALKLKLPARSGEIVIEAPYPKDMAALVKQIEKLSGGAAQPPHLEEYHNAGNAGGNAVGSGHGRNNAFQSP
ncbi:MAG: RluA family pseudouridine synthase, partial [Spirochaetaceae bacterium]|jgi:RluA family pseudouridine synthase|nr:RluA family pseudouridine synthase [Spirochaetaceae bacterium]